MGFTIYIFYVFEIFLIKIFKEVICKNRIFSIYRILDGLALGFFRFRAFREHEDY